MEFPLRSGGIAWKPLPDFGRDRIISEDGARVARRTLKFARACVDSGRSQPSMRASRYTGSSPRMHDDHRRRRLNDSHRTRRRVKLSSVDLLGFRSTVYRERSSPQRLAARDAGMTSERELLRVARTAAGITKTHSGSRMSLTTSAVDLEML